MSPIDQLEKRLDFYLNNSHFPRSNRGVEIALNRISEITLDFSKKWELKQGIPTPIVSSQSTELTDKYIEEISLDIWNSLQKILSDYAKMLEERVEQAKTYWEGIVHGVGFTMFSIYVGDAGLQWDSIEDVEIIKVWQTKLDKKVRAEHVALQGEERAWGEPFSNGLMWPRDVTGQPAQIYNCRCWVDLEESKK